MKVLDDQHDRPGSDGRSDRRDDVSGRVAVGWAELADDVEGSAERAGLGGCGDRRNAGGEPGDELAQQPGLADACLARHQHQLGAVAGGDFDGFDQAGQSRECRGATDHRRRQAMTPGQHRVDDTSEVISRRSGHFVGSPRVRIRRARRRRESPSAARRQMAPCCGRTSRCRVAALRRRVWRSALMAAVSWLLWNMRRVCALGVCHHIG